MNIFWFGRELIVQWYSCDKDKRYLFVSWFKMVWKNFYIYFLEDLILFDEMLFIFRTVLEEGQMCVEFIRFRISLLVILDDEFEVQFLEFLVDIV